MRKSTIENDFAKYLREGYVIGNVRIKFFLCFLSIKFPQNCQAVFDCCRDKWVEVVRCPYYASAITFQVILFLFVCFVIDISRLVRLFWAATILTKMCTPTGDTWYLLHTADLQIKVASINRWPPHEEVCTGVFRSVDPEAQSFLQLNPPGGGGFLVWFLIAPLTIPYMFNNSRCQRKPKKNRFLFISSLAGPSGRAYLGSRFEMFMAQTSVLEILRPD